MMKIYIVDKDFSFGYKSLLEALSKNTLRRSMKIDVHETSLSGQLCKVADEGKLTVNYVNAPLETFSLNDAILKLISNGQMTSHLALRAAKFGNRAVLKLYIQDSHDAYEWTRLYGSANLMYNKIKTPIDALYFSKLTNFKYLNTHLSLMKENDWVCFHLAKFVPNLRTMLSFYINSESCAYHYMQFFGISEHLLKLIVSDNWKTLFEDLVRPYPPSYTLWNENENI